MFERLIYRNCETRRKYQLPGEKQSFLQSLTILKRHFQELDIDFIVIPRVTKIDYDVIRTVVEKLSKKLSFVSLNSFKVREISRGLLSNVFEHHSI